MKKLNIYFTAGVPKLNDTAQIMKTIQSAGADMIEVGIPYSDPVADGPVIQNSSHIALQNGMNLKILFQIIYTVDQSNNLLYWIVKFFLPN